MADYTNGYFGTQASTVEAVNDVTVAIRNWFPNRNPLFTRLAHRPTGQVTFTTYTHAYRAGSTVLTAAVASTTTTTITVSDATFLMNHDLIEIVDATNGSEVVQVWSDTAQGGTAITGSAGSYVVTVKRGMGGTTPITASNTDTCYVYSNARSGSEINQTGLSTIGVPHTQYCQTFQFPVQVGGAAESTTAQVFPMGIESPLEYNRYMQLQNMVDSIEQTIYYGRAEAPTSTDATTAKSDGLFNWLSTNNVTAPVNASAYSMTDLSRDLFNGPVSNGGQPDLLVVSPNFQSAFQTWGSPLVRLPAGATELGVDIQVFRAPFLNDINVVLAPLLRPYTAIALTSAEVLMRPKRVPFWLPRAMLGDMFQGDWIFEGAIQVINEQHHAAVRGITAFAAN
jgi:hypothetical protein